jgi:hypothetical protein
MPVAAREASIYTGKTLLPCLPLAMQPQAQISSLKLLVLCGRKHQYQKYNFTATYPRIAKVETLHG